MLKALPFSTTPESPGKEILPLSGILIFMTAAHGTPLGCLASGQWDLHFAVPQDWAYLHTLKFLPEGLASNQSESKCSGLPL